MERKMILNCIYANDLTTLKNNSEVILEKSLNWLEPHPRTDLDELISPLTCAAFLGRLHIMEFLLENQNLELEMTTIENEYTALHAACMAGRFDCVSYLCENGADVNAMNSMGQTRLIYCFSRITETENVFENKSICFRIAETLFKYGADVNKYSKYGQTLLMEQCGISMMLDDTMLEINLAVIQFLVEHGADPYKPHQITGKNSFEQSNNHCAADQIKMTLMNTKRLHHHPVLTETSKREAIEEDDIVQTKGLSVGCCGSMFSFCGF